ncbi:MAG: hypothetical protein WC602_06610, partial [archaeon]
NAFPKEKQVAKRITSLREVQRRKTTGSGEMISEEALPSGLGAFECQASFKIVVFSRIAL